MTYGVVSGNTFTQSYRYVPDLIKLMHWDQLVVCGDVYTKQAIRSVVALPIPIWVVSSMYRDEFLAVKKKKENVTFDPYILAERFASRNVIITFSGDVLMSVQQRHVTYDAFFFGNKEQPLVEYKGTQVIISAGFADTSEHLQLRIPIGSYLPDTNACEMKWNVISK